MTEKQYVVIRHTSYGVDTGYGPTGQEQLVFGPASKDACENYKRNASWGSDMGFHSWYSVRLATVTVSY